MGSDIEFPETPLYYIGKKSNRAKTPKIYGLAATSQLTSIRYNSVLTYEIFEDWQEYLAIYNIEVKLDDNGDWYLVD